MLQLRRTFEARPETVFDAFTKPDELAKPWGPKRMTTPVAEIDLRVGGACLFDMAEPNGASSVSRASFARCAPPRSWPRPGIWELGDMTGVESLITIEFADRGAATELTFTHALLPNERPRAIYG